MTQRLKNYYYKTIIPKLISIREFKYKNSYEAPSVKKIVVNRGIGDASQNNKILESSH